MMNQKNLLLKTLMIIVFIFFLYLNIYSFICLNGAGSGYNDGVGEEGLMVCNSATIESYIVEGAWYYLNANESIQALLKYVEIKDRSGVDFTKIQYIVGRALFNMNLAKETYEKLIKKAEATPYNEAVLIKLKAFDYDAFLEKNRLNSSVMDNVRGYLQGGNITGAFKYSYGRFLEIIELLKAVQQDSVQYKVSDISIFWQINETLSDLSAFGSYIARIFAEINR